MNEPKRAITDQRPQPAEIEAKLKEAFDYRLIDLKRSIDLTHALMKQCEEEGYEKEIARAKNNLGLFYLIRGEFQRAISFSEDALRYYKKENDPKGAADAKYNIGSVYYRTTRYHEGLIYLLDCLQVYRETDDYYNQARTLKSAGTIYEYFNDLEKAKEYYEKSIEASLKISDRSTESNALNPLSGIYSKQGLLTLASVTIERSIALKKETKDIRGLAYAYYGRAKISLRKESFKDALADLKESVRILSHEDDKLGIGMAYNKMGLAYLGDGDNKKAKIFFLKALALAEKFNVHFILFKVQLSLYHLARKEGDAIQALDYLEKYVLNKEIVINKEAYNIIKSYEAISKIETLEREAKSQLEKNEIIEGKNAELDSFFYRVSHDIKGPISSLLGLHSLVKMEIQHKPSLNLFNLYHSQVTRLNNIVMGLIKLTETKNAEELKIAIDFASLVDECIESCRYLPQFPRLLVEKNIEDINFKSEWAIINTILQNLIENGIKYSRPELDPYIKINIYSDASYLFLVVEDNGQGIGESHKNNIFNMFYRATDRAHGSGLGLYILKRAIERLKGTIEVSSTINIGSKFTVRLPME